MGSFGNTVSGHNSGSHTTANNSSNTVMTKPEKEKAAAAPEDLRLFLSRKRPRLKSEQSSDDDEVAKAVRSVVVIPK